MIGRWRHRLWQYWLARCARSAATNKATKITLRALARIPGRAFTSWHCLGQLWAAAGDQLSAIECYQRALDTGSVGDPTLYHHLAIALMALGRYTEAEAHLLHSIAHKPWAWWSHKALGEILLQKGDWSRAQAQFERVLELNNAEPWSHFHLFEARRVTLGPERALLKWLDGVLEAPRMPALHMRVGTLWTERGDYTALHIEKLQQVAARYPDCTEVTYITGFLLGQLGRVEEATRSLGRYMQQAWARDYGSRAEPPIPVKEPEFIIIGMAKCGSTALYSYLTDHPLVCPAIIKEVCFWDRYYDYGLDWYRACFMPIPLGARQITGEGSITSLLSEQAPARVAAFRADMKLLLIIRDPVARAWSDYHMRRRLGHKLPAWEALVEQELRDYPQCPQEPEQLPRAGWAGSVLLEGAVLPYLKRWRSHFPARQFLILRNEELSRDVQQTVDIAYDFLGLPRHSLSSTARSNVGSYAALSPDLEQRLRDWYQPHQDALANFLATEMA